MCKTITSAIVALTLLAVPGWASAATILSGSVITHQFDLIDGSNASDWRGPQGIIATWNVVDLGGLYQYTFNISGKQGVNLQRAVQKVVIGIGNASNALVNGSAIGSNFSTDSTKSVFDVTGRKLEISFTSAALPDNFFIRIFGNDVRARVGGVALGSALPLGDDTGHIGDDNNTNPGGGTPVAAPLPAAAWAGLSMLGVMGAAGYFRRRRQEA